MKEDNVFWGRGRCGKCWKDNIICMVSDNSWGEYREARICIICLEQVIKECKEFIKVVIAE